jgi:hypothetical protein
VQRDGGLRPRGGARRRSGIVVAARDEHEDHHERGDEDGEPGQRAEQLPAAVRARRRRLGFGSWLGHTSVAPGAAAQRLARLRAAG